MQNVLPLKSDPDTAVCIHLGAGERPWVSLTSTDGPRFFQKMKSASQHLGRWGLHYGLIHIQVSTVLEILKEI